MEKELEDLLPSFPSWSSLHGIPGIPNDQPFWAFLILRCHNRKDIQHKALRNSLLNSDYNTEVKIREDLGEFGCSCIPVSCFNGLFWHWVPVNEDLSHIEETYEDEDDVVYCEMDKSCPLYAEEACRGLVAIPASLSQSDIASWLCWDIIAKLSSATTRKVAWDKQGYKRTVRYCTYEIPEPYCDQVDPLSVASEVVNRFESISRYEKLKAPEVGSSVERQGRKVIPITLRTWLTEEGFETCLEVLEATRIASLSSAGAGPSAASKAAVTSSATKSAGVTAAGATDARGKHFKTAVATTMQDVSDLGCAGQLIWAVGAFIGVMIALRLYMCILG